MHLRPRFGRWSGVGMILAALACGAVAAFSAGCRLVQATAEIPVDAMRTVSGAKPEKPPPDPVVLQQEVFRFVDDFSAFAGGEYRRLQGKFATVSEDRLLESQINLEYRLLEIASGANSFGNLIDLTFSVVLIRHQLEAYALPLDAEGHLRPTVASLEQYQQQIMALVRETLGEEQQQQLRENIMAWVDKNISSESGLHARYPGPISDLLAAGKAQRQGALTNLIGSLMLDPFAGLDPTVREIAQARLFAERAMFVTQRMPHVLQLELELFKRRTLATPEIARLMANVDTVTRTVERVGLVVETLPDRLRDEREGLTELVRETRATFDASARAMEQVNAVVLSTDTFLGHLGVGDQANAPGPAPAPAASPEGSAPAAPSAFAAPPGPAQPPGEPFRIQDYTSAAAQLAETAERLNTLVVTLDRTLATATSDEVAAKVDAASQAAVVRGREVVDHAFRRGLIFVALTCVMVVLSMVLHRLVIRRPRA